MMWIFYSSLHQWTGFLKTLSFWRTTYVFIRIKEAYIKLYTLKKTTSAGHQSLKPRKWIIQCLNRASCMTPEPGWKAAKCRSELALAVSQDTSDAIVSKEKRSSLLFFIAESFIKLSDATKAECFPWPSHAVSCCCYRCNQSEFENSEGNTLFLFGFVCRPERAGPERASRQHQPRRRSLQIWRAGTPSPFSVLILILCPFYANVNV